MRNKTCRSSFRKSIVMPPRKRKQATAQATSTEDTSSKTLEPAKLTVAVLREELESRGLDTGGRKAELVARLEAQLKMEASTGPSPKKKGRKAKKPEPEPKEEPEVRNHICHVMLLCANVRCYVTSFE